MTASPAQPFRTPPVTTPSGDRYEVDGKWGDPDRRTPEVYKNGVATGLGIESILHELEVEGSGTKKVRDSLSKVQDDWIDSLP